MSHVIGIDVGSQSVKGVLFDDHGTAIAEAGVPYEMSYPCSGWADQDPGCWEQGIARTVRELRARAGIGPGEVAMLALACQVDGLVALDDDLRPLRPAIIWLDRRATRQSARLSEAVGEAELIARTGLNPDASHTAPKAMWLSDEEPEHYRAARWLAPVRSCRIRPTRPARSSTTSARATGTSNWSNRPVWTPPSCRRSCPRPR